MKIKARFLIAWFLSWFALAAASGSTPVLTPDRLAGLKIPAAEISLPTTGAEVTSAVLVLASDAGNTLGEYCKVIGAIHPIDPQAPDIRFQVNLPTHWNGKALQMGGAGYNSQEGIMMQIGSQSAYREPPVSGPNAHHVARADQFMKYFVARDPRFSLRTFDIMNPGPLKERIIRISEMIGATNPDFEKMRARGGKILWVQGTEDPSVSPFENIKIYRAIVAKMGSDKVASFLRFYLVPGLAHGGGRFSVTWDNLAILDNWVENEVPPPVTPGVDINPATLGRSRPMCEYPSWPKYRGTGDVNDWRSYVIVKP